MAIRISSIHRATLHKTLHLPDKLDAGFEGVFKNVKCYSEPPEWYEKDNSSDRDLLRDPPLLGEFTIKINKSKETNGRGKSSFHRVFVVCKCGKDVPAGRIGQHRCKHWPSAQMIAEYEARAEARKAKWKAREEEIDHRNIANIMRKMVDGIYIGEEGVKNFKHDVLFQWGVSQKRDEKLTAILAEHDALPYHEKLECTLSVYAEWVRKRGN
jgi:hypothetical protein